jgi:hypothetical protein
MLLFFSVVWSGLGLVLDKDKGQVWVSLGFLKCHGPEKGRITTL